MQFLLNEGRPTNTWITYRTDQTTAYAIDIANAAEDELLSIERECCLQCVPTLQLLRQRRCERTAGHTRYLHQLVKAVQYAQRRTKFRKVNRRKIRS